MDGRRVRVVVADDRPLIRSQLRDLLDAEPDLDVVGTGWSGTEVAAHLGVTGMEIRVVMYKIDDGEQEQVVDGDSSIAQCVLDDESVGALMTAIRRPPARRLTARAN